MGGGAIVTSGRLRLVTVPIGGVEGSVVGLLLGVAVAGHLG